ncbi:MAG: hypothetical protein JXR37_01870 [Kiritimatiellae bacterium]|nr:hypothetical protein [Kiritimatiellia bacterium]
MKTIRAANLWVQTGWTAMLGVFLGAVAGPARADLDDIPIPTGETVVFSDDFDDNTREWDNVVKINAFGTLTEGAAAINADPGGTGESVLYVSLASNTLLQIRAPMSIKANVSDTDIAVYFRVRTDDTDSDDTVRVAGLSSSAVYYVGQYIQPSTGGGQGEGIQYNVPNYTLHTSQMGSYCTFTDTNDYRVLRLVMSSTNATEMFMKAYILNEGTGQYDYKQTVNTADFDGENHLITEDFTTLEVRFAADDGWEGLYVDAVAVTADITPTHTTVAGIPVPVGEHVVFSDDFEDNAEGWSNVAVVNGSGTPAADKAAIGPDPGSPAANVLYASAPDGATAVQPEIVFGDRVNLTRGPANLYVRMRSDNGDTYDRVIMTLQNPAGIYGQIRIKPTNGGGGAEHLRYRNGSGTDDGVNFYGDDSITFPNSNAYEIVRLKLYQSGADETTLEAWTWDPEGGAYHRHDDGGNPGVFVRGPAEGGLITADLFSVLLQIETPHAGELMYVDSVVVTGYPKGGTLLILR